jgi:Asp-tRNA(Asn)/Glu-tRNA(Gln) amidotransferase A subunit family amidase
MPVLDTWDGLGTLQGKKDDGREKAYEIVQSARIFGAILYVKTSVPRWSFSTETNNHIIGLTTNPKNRILWLEAALVEKADFLR